MNYNINKVDNEVNIQFNKAGSYTIKGNNYIIPKNTVFKENNLKEILSKGDFINKFNLFDINDDGLLGSVAGELSNYLKYIVIDNNDNIRKIYSDLKPYELLTTKSLFITKNVTEIDDNKFDYLPLLESLYIQEGLTSIGNNNFKSCLKLQNIILPDSLISIGDNSFKDCYSVKNLILGHRNQNFGENVFLNINTKTCNLVYPKFKSTIEKDAWISNIPYCLWDKDYSSRPVLHTLESNLNSGSGDKYTINSSSPIGCKVKFSSVIPEFITTGDIKSITVRSHHDKISVAARPLKLYVLDMEKNVIGSSYNIVTVDKIESDYTFLFNNLRVDPSSYYYIVFKDINDVYSTYDMSVSRVTDPNMYMVVYNNPNLVRKDSDNFVIFITNIIIESSGLVSTPMVYRNKEKVELCDNSIENDLMVASEPEKQGILTIITHKKLSFNEPECGDVLKKATINYSVTVTFPVISDLMDKINNVLSTLVSLISGIFSSLISIGSAFVDTLLGWLWPGNWFADKTQQINDVAAQYAQQYISQATSFVSSLANSAIPPLTYSVDYVNGSPINAGEAAASFVSLVDAITDFTNLTNSKLTGWFDGIDSSMFDSAVSKDSGQQGVMSKCVQEAAKLGMDVYDWIKENKSTIETWVGCDIFGAIIDANSIRNFIDSLDAIERISDASFSSINPIIAAVSLIPDLDQSVTGGYLTISSDVSCSLKVDEAHQHISCDYPGCNITVHPDHWGEHPLTLPDEPPTTEAVVKQFDLELDEEETEENLNILGGLKTSSNTAEIINAIKSLTPPDYESQIEEHMSEWEEEKENVISNIKSSLESIKTESNTEFQACATAKAAGS